MISNILTVDECLSLIATIFSDDNEIEIVQGLSGYDAQAFIDTIIEASFYTFLPAKSWLPLKLPHPIGQALDRVTPQIRTKCLRTLHSICGHQTLLPQSLEIAPRYNTTEGAMCHGGFGDTWKGQYQDREVAIKVLKVYRTSDLGQIRKVGRSCHS